MPVIVLGPVGSGQQAVAYPGSAGDVVYNRFEASIVVGQANAVVDIGSIPAGCRVVDAILENDALGTGVTCTVGPMSGTPGSTDTARDLVAGQEMFAAATGLTTAAAVRMSATTGFRIAPVAVERSIGVKLAGTVPATAGKVIVGVWLAAA